MAEPQKQNPLPVRGNKQAPESATALPSAAGASTGGAAADRHGSSSSGGKGQVFGGATSSGDESRKEQQKSQQVGGTTTIDDDVVAKTAGLAARSVPGVHDLGGGFSRALGSVREKMTDANPTQGVSIEKGEKEAVVDLVLQLRYGYSCREVADKVREKVAEDVHTCTGLEVREVNIEVNDVHIPSDGEDSGDNSSCRHQESDRGHHEQSQQRRSGQ